MKSPWPFTEKFDAYLAGGAVLSVATKQEISDYDVYPRNKSVAAELLFYLMDEQSCFIVNITDKAVTLKCNNLLSKSTGERAIFQIMIYDSFESPEKIFANFDFTVCMAAYDLKEDKLITHEKFWEDVASRSLRFNTGTLYPLNSLTRIAKYREKGYRTGKGELAKIALAIAKKGMPNSWDELEAELGGTYGRITKINSEGKEFSFDTAIEILSELEFSLREEWSDYSQMSADDLGDIIEQKCTKIQMGNDWAYVNDLNEIFVVLQNDISFVPFHNKDFVIGWKNMRYDSNGIYKPGNRVGNMKGSDFRYKIGEFSEEQNEPYIFVFFNEAKAKSYSSSPELTRMKVLVPIESLVYLKTNDGIYTAKKVMPLGNHPSHQSE